MKKTMHKISAVAIAIILLISAMVVPAFADPTEGNENNVPKSNGGAYVTKDFRMAEGVTAGKQTFEINVEKAKFDDADDTAAKAKMPEIGTIQLEVGDGAQEPTVDSNGIKHYVASKDIFEGVTFSQPGKYEYTVSEAQDTATGLTSQESIEYSAGQYTVTAYVAKKEVPVIDPDTNEPVVDDEGNPVTEEQIVVDDVVVVVDNPDNENQNQGDKVDPNEPGTDPTVDPTEAPTEDPEAPTQDPEAPTSEPSTEEPGQPGGDSGSGANGFVFTNTYAKKNNSDPDDEDNQTPNPENPDKPFINPDIFDDGLFIGKEVTGKYGNTEQEFDFTVKVTKPTLPGHDSTTADAFIVNGDNSLERKLTVTYGEDTAVKLSSGQKLVFANVYYGSKWTATEANGESLGYDVSQAIKSGGADKDASAAPFIVSDAGANFHKFTNDKDNDPSITGVLINNLPYFIVFAIALAGFAVYFVAKRRRQDEE